jgi:integrase
MANNAAQARRAQGEGSIYFDADRNRWVGQVWIGNRRRKVSGRTKRDTTDKLGRLRHAGAAEQEADRKMTVGRLLDEWRTKAVPNRGLSPSSIDTHDWAIGHWRETLGRRRAAELRPTHVEAAMVTMVAKHQLSRSSLIKIRSTLNQAMAWAVKRGDLPRNAAVGAELPVNAVGRRPTQALTEAQVDQLVTAAAGHEWEAMYLLMLTVGLRLGEAAGVSRGAVNLDAGTVTIKQSVRTHGGRPYVSPELKNAGAFRTIELPKGTLASLRRHLEANPGRTDLLFTAPDGGPVWPSTVRSELDKLTAAAGVPGVTPNELRHTAATILCQYLPAHVVADILGHRTTRMLDLHYRHRPPVVTGASVMDNIVGPQLRAVS